MFDKIYCINLPFDEIRWQISLNEFSRFGLTDIFRIDGVKHEDPTIGCNLAHVNLLTHAKKNGYDKILLFEDDVLFVEDYSVMRACAEQVDDNWDLIYFGGYVYKMNDGMSDEEYVKYSGDYTKHSNNLLRLTGGRAAQMHALGIRSTMFDLLIDRFSKINKIESFFSDIDDHWLSMYVKDNWEIIKAFYAVPTIVIQRPGYSNIQKRETDLDVRRLGLYKELLKIQLTNV